MDNRQEYHYPDTGDALTIALIHTESTDAYWQASESHVLELALQFLQTHGTIGRMLDLGCGMGRLLPVFSPHVRTLEGLEPDKERCDAAMRMAASLPNTAVYQGDYRNMAGSYDAVLCSHVIQHIPRSDCTQLFARLAVHTAPGALVLLTTTYTPEDADRFVRESFVAGKRQCTPTNAATFDAGAPLGSLPVRFFAASTLESLASRSGFRIVARYGYHFAAPADILSVELDQARNAAGDLRAARDMLYLLQREDHHG